MSDVDRIELAAAQQARKDQLLDEFIDGRLEILFASKDVGPDARHKLRGILRHYAKQRHPFRACVKDNMKRFGPGRTEAVCATLKDIIRGTTKWRNNAALDHGSPGAIAASDNLCEVPELDEETAQLLFSISDEDLDALMDEAILYA